MSKLPKVFRPIFLNWGGIYIGYDYKDKKAFLMKHDMECKGWYIPVENLSDPLQQDIIDVLRKHFSEDDVNFALSGISEE